MSSCSTQLRERGLDRASAGDREEWIVSALRAQISFAGRNVPFWSGRLRSAGIEPDGIHALADFAKLPPLGKDELRRVAPLELVPPSSRHRLHLCRSTSGTTGPATSVFWTRADWSALIETMARALGDQQPVKELIAFNGYHLGHAAGRAYEDVVRLLGGISIPRHYSADDETATFAQLKTFACNTLILTQRSGLKKSGRAVDDLLAADAEFFRRHGIRWWLGSSGTFTTEGREAARRQGVLRVTNLYGSSEFGTLAVSCVERPSEFHLAFGHVFVEVVDDAGIPVRSGERGRIVASHLFASHGDGGLGPHEGSQLLRLDNGDEATFLEGACACGLSSPRIEDIRRREPEPTR